MGLARRRINRLPGVRDVTGSDYHRFARATDTLRVHLSDAGYQVIDTPLLEETELFIRKSGGALTGRLYTFTDPGGNKVSLRPEFTSSVIRYFIQERDSLKTPVRLQYAGPVFRYEQGVNGSYRQFTQVGAEMVGKVGVEADSEIIRLAWEGLEQVGLREHQLRIGHLGILHDLLSTFRLSEPAKLFIISNVHDMKNGHTDVSALKERAQGMGLLTGGVDPGLEPDLINMENEAAQEFIQTVLRDSMPAPIGQRTTEQIVARLLRKVSGADDPGVFEHALGLTEQLAHLGGSPDAVLTQARCIGMGRGLNADAFGDLEGLLDTLAARGVPGSQIVLDFGLAREISYYTGVIFELTYPSNTHEALLGGGGRYDGLVKALGSDDDVPALGFAYSIEQVVEVLNPSGHVVSQALGDGDG